MSGMELNGRRNRLFEALGNIVIPRPSPQLVPRVPLRKSAIPLDVVPPVEHLAPLEPQAELADHVPSGASDIALAEVTAPTALPDAETAPIVPEDVSPDFSMFDAAPPMPEHQAHEVQLCPEDILQNVAPFDLTLLIPEPEAERTELLPEDRGKEISRSDETLVLPLFQEETEEPTPANDRLGLPESDRELSTAAPESEPQPVVLLPQHAPQEPREFEVSLLAEMAGEDSVAILSEDAPQDLSLLALIPWSPEPVVETLEPEPLSVCPETPPFELTPPTPWVEAEPEQLALEIIPREFPLYNVPRRAGPEARTVLAQAPEEAPKKLEAKAIGLEAIRRIRVKVPSESRLVALTSPDGLGAEKFRALVTRLEHLHRSAQLKSFQVISSVVSEGKTLVSGNVAVTLAKYSGAKTLLIEGDLHRPMLASLFGLNKMRGVSDWWNGREQQLSPFVHELDGFPLSILCAGGPCDRPADILRSARFANAFAQLASEFEWIVVDSTPMLPIVDVNLWSRLLDGTILVVREGVTPVKALKQGLRALDHPNLIGVVMNDASAVSESKYDGQYYHSSNRHQDRKRYKG